MAGGMRTWKLLLGLLLMLPDVTQAQFTFITNTDNTITITGYTQFASFLTIPDTINGLPVTGITNLTLFDSFDLSPSPTA